MVDENELIDVLDETTLRLADGGTVKAEAVATRAANANVSFMV
jgi:hypothetical protein